MHCLANYKNDPKKKRYYWLQLKEDFFNQKEIKLLRRIAGGDTYTIIYLKMLLTSLRDEGKLYFESIGEDFTEEVALAIDEKVEDVSITISYLEKKGLLEIIEQDEYFLSKVPEMVGSEAYSTERSRRHRAKKRVESNGNLLQRNGEALQCNNGETERNEEIDIELEKEKRIDKVDRDKDLNSYLERRGENNKNILLTNETAVNNSALSTGDNEVVSQVIDYLNEKAETSYKTTTKDNQTLINNKIVEGFNLDDFKKVIDIKVMDWRGDDVMDRYLRPSTLFGDKMEDYLSEANKLMKRSNRSYKPPKIDYNDEYARTFLKDPKDNTGVYF